MKTPRSRTRTIGEASVAFTDVTDTEVSKRKCKSRKTTSARTLPDASNMDATAIPLASKESHLETARNKQSPALRVPQPAAAVIEVLHSQTSPSAKEKRNRKSSKKQEPQLFIQMEPVDDTVQSSVFDNVGKKPSDFDGCITSITIHGADTIHFDPNVMAPMVQVHIVGAFGACSKVFFGASQTNSLHSH